MKKNRKKLTLNRETIGNLALARGAECVETSLTNGPPFNACCFCCEPDQPTPTLDGGCHDFTGGAC